MPRQAPRPLADQIVEGLAEAAAEVVPRLMRERGERIAEENKERTRKAEKAETLARGEWPESLKKAMWEKDSTLGPYQTVTTVVLKELLAERNKEKQADLKRDQFDRRKERDLLRDTKEQDPTIKLSRATARVLDLSKLIEEKKLFGKVAIGNDPQKLADYEDEIEGLTESLAAWRAIEISARSKASPAPPSPSGGGLPQLPTTSPAASPPSQGGILRGGQILTAPPAGPQPKTPSPSSTGSLPGLR